MRTLLCKLGEYNSISIIGMDKNVGKTTTLNSIINKARGKFTLGLTSIGRDGEEEDIVIGTKKPRIYVSRNTFMATAKRCLANSDITREIIDTTGINTPMGEIILLKALSDGYVELAGPSLNTYIKDICIRLKKLGSDFVLCDGATSRRTFASPTITDATILCTGASLGRDMYKVVDETIHTIRLLSINKTRDKNVKSLMNVSECKVCIIDKSYNIKKLNVLTSLEAAKDIVESLDDNSKYVIIKGIVSDRLLQGIMGSTNRYKDIVFIIEDGTKLFVSKEVYNTFLKSGGRIECFTKVELIGVTINPVSPFGYEFDKDKFKELISSEIHVPVYNIYSDKI